jgi:hypothetical protein
MSVSIRGKRVKHGHSNRGPARSKSGERKPCWSDFRERYGLTRKALARMTGLSERTLATREAGGEISEVGERALISVKRLLDALAEVVAKDTIAHWLEEPNDAFGDLKPVEVMERGETDRLWRMIYFLGSGVAS